MKYTLEDLIVKYAVCNKMTAEEAAERYENGEIGKKDLLGAYLCDEGIFGYTDTLWGIFEAFVDGVPVVYAQWEMAPDGDGVVCPVCRTDFCVLLNETNRFIHCPHCGAKMVLEAT